jgi:hypothetical protein
LNTKKSKPKYRHIEVESSLTHELKVLAVNLGFHQRVVASAILELALGDAQFKAKLTEKLSENQP